MLGNCTPLPYLKHGRFCGFLATLFVAFLCCEELFKGKVKAYSIGDGMIEDKPVRCQKCGKPIGYVTVLGRGLTGLQQPVPNVKVVAICMECAQKKKQ